MEKLVNLEKTQKQIVALDVETAQELNRFLGSLPYDLVKANESLIEKFRGGQIVEISVQDKTEEKENA